MTRPSAAGVLELPGAGDVTEKLRPPIELHALLDANFWSGAVFEESFDQQMPMFQPVGGMDHIPYAFAKRLGRVIQYRSAVKASSESRLRFRDHSRPPNAKRTGNRQARNLCSHLMLKTICQLHDQSPVGSPHTPIGRAPDAR